MDSISTQDELHRFLTIARRISQEAGAMLLDLVGRVTASQKRDGTLVTQADQATDRFICHALATAFPDHAILSEEQSTVYDPNFAYTWVVDPLDGTTNFARGAPIWGTSIALLLAGEPVLGVLSFPSLHEEYEGILHEGAYRNGHRIYADTLKSVDDQHFIMLCTRTLRRLHVNTPLKPRTFGSAAYHLVSVATGISLAGIESTPKLWDIAASLLILTEAGGRYASLVHRRIFPLLPERRDYEHVAYPLLAAANEEILKEVEHSIVKQ